MSKLKLPEEKINNTIIQIKNKYGDFKNPISSSLQTKNWRKKQLWYTTSKRTECEKYQRAMIEEHTQKNCKKSSGIRINYDTNEIKKKRYPLKNVDGFEWSEDFDGIQEFGENKLYYNLKFVCGVGGSQTRSLREVYHFIRGQLKYLLKENQNLYFINILDGDTCYTHKDKFNYLVSKKKYTEISSNIFIGDMKSFHKWFISFNK